MRVLVVLDVASMPVVAIGGNRRGEREGRPLAGVVDDA